MRKHILLISGIALVILSVISGWIQSTYYGYIDADGILRDSLFLPLMFIFMFLGVAVLMVWAVRAIWRSVKASKAAA